MKQIYYYFLDHTFFDAKKIAFEIEDHVKANLEASIRKGTIEIFCTCQRIEIFSSYRLASKDLSDFPFKEIIEYKEIRKRLLEISTGTKSQILAETNIYYQLLQYTKYHCKNIWLKEFLKSVLKEAESIRKQYQFNSPYGYEDIAISLNRTRLTDRLVVFGSGMLARGIYDKVKDFHFSEVLYLTRRNPKNLKKKLGVTEDWVNVKRVNSPRILTLKSKPFYTIIATSNIDLEYENQILTIISFEECKGVFDLSSKPRFQDRVKDEKHYSDIYSDDYLQKVQNLNEGLLKKQFKVINIQIT